MDGPTQYEGRVEVFYAGAFATICDDWFEIADADVVCHQLGFWSCSHSRVLWAIW
eukprot:TRINITY_DN11463_c0_g1_i1.p3 TRINITY_DN11463_c0_g1~~TRINITY_DN11463_c0_g1_i1.p3  ORF type:complete len:55 (-),score=3.37 TRINITY_DN11463_c0_g1_i1:25-189(-)